MTKRPATESIDDTVTKKTDGQASKEEEKTEKVAKEESSSQDTAPEEKSDGQASKEEEKTEKVATEESSSQDTAPETEEERKYREWRAEAEEFYKRSGQEVPRTEYIHSHRYEDGNLEFTAKYTGFSLQKKCWTNADFIDDEYTISALRKYYLNLKQDREENNDHSLDKGFNVMAEMFEEGLNAEVKKSSSSKSLDNWLSTWEIPKEDYSSSESSSPGEIKQMTFVDALNMGIINPIVFPNNQYNFKKSKRFNRKRDREIDSNEIDQSDPRLHRRMSR
uniref:Chromo domain-containing protein n=1 Tax=Caenorhabditis tropicalis TaxID=1561998 RepID=A0A1I7TXZ1_9PELO